MKKLVVAAGVLALAGGLAVRAQQEQEKKHEKPEVRKEHAWLHKFAGHWDLQCRSFLEEGKAPTMSKGTEHARMLGDYWLQSEIKGEMQGTPFTGLWTLGYDPRQKHFVGTWVDSMSPYLWKYEGHVDEAGQVLTLSTEGPCPHLGLENAKFRDVVELKTPDHKVLTSFVEKDGKWVKMMQIDFRRRPE